MLETPIIFSGAMVRAILDDLKTQTRRVMKEADCWRNGLSRKNHVVSLDHAYPQSDRKNLRVPYRHKDDPEWPWDECGHWKVYPRHEIGDKLWVRETLEMSGNARWLRYTTDHQLREPRARWRWKPYILPARFMPKWAARIWLLVTDVRVERLQEITEEHAIVEGAMIWWNSLTRYQQEAIYDGGRGPIAAFRNLWDNLNAKRGYGWNANPWVQVVTFERIQP